SVLLSYGGRNVVMDTGPDFRSQAMAVHLDRLDAILYTHGHADHIFGLDDIRPYNLKQKAAIPIYAAEATLQTLRRSFAYIFDTAPTDSSLPGVELHTIEGPFTLFRVEIIPVPAMHGPGQGLGFRFGNAAYLTDFSTIPESSKALLKGLDHFILDALRYTPHPMHSTVTQSLGLVTERKANQAWFPHNCHDLGHAETNAKFPDNVRLAHDGLRLEASY